MRPQGFAPGKLVLFGEHAVVYGHPALALAVDRGTRVVLEPVRGPTRILAADPRFTAAGDPRLDRALRLLLPAEGLGLRIETELPVGRGMGSSAALAVALVRSLAAWEGRTASLQECIERGFAFERIFHGTPSGLDHTVSARGGALCYRRGPDGPELQAVDVADLPLVVLDTGIAGDTAALVAGVRARRPTVDPLLAEIGHLVEAMLAPLARGDLPSLGRGMLENQRLLQGLGVSSPEIEALVDLARTHGALGAKLAGSGGGGVVVALAPEPQRLLAAARAQGVPAFEAGVAPAPEAAG